MNLQFSRNVLHGHYTSNSWNGFAVSWLPIEVLSQQIEDI